MKFKKFAVVLVAASLGTSFAVGTAGAATKKTTKKVVKTTKTTKPAGKTTASTAAPTTLPAKAAPGTIWNNPPCDPAKPKYKVGITTVFTSPVLSLIDQVTALEASVKAFNGRGGIGGHCMDLTTCDDKNDPNQEVACARKMNDDGIVVTLNDTTSVNGPGFQEVALANKLPRFEVSPGSENLASTAIPNSWAIGAGGSGTTFMMIPRCTKAGHTKIGMIHVDLPAIDGLKALLGTMLKAYNAELVAAAPVPGGTTDYQQFILAMQKAGATCIILPLGETEAKQVLRAAQQLGAKETFSASLGTFALADTASFGDFAGQLLLNAEIPPATQVDQFPLLKTAVADLEASGKPELKKDQIKSSPLRSWIAVYHLVRIIEDFGTPDVISREAVTNAINKATNLNTGGLIPTWTPSNRVLPESHPFYKPFGNISQPWYWQINFDPKTKSWVILPDKIHATNELTGQIKYDQPK